MLRSRTWLRGALALGGALALALTAAAADAPAKRVFAARVEIPGKIVCIGCTLEQQEGGADAQCTLHAKHAQGLLLADGTLWTFVDNVRGHHLITEEKLRGQEVKVLGWKFPKAQYVEAWRYSLRKGDAWVGYDFCKGCGWEPGDNADRDTCDDCAKE